ncbi:MAG: SpoIIE family protein phosphatase [Phycisphaerae bacterium]|nr:SpoIIE family protein phosphatase [Phycisphaerae bacterium]
MDSIDLTSSRLPALVLDSANAGVYVTDTERRIIYWNKAAQRITGWQADEILGKQCLDQVLCHVDKDGRELCGEEFCPLHRAITTGTSSDVPIIVFARTANGGRVPMRVSVAPLRAEDGRIVGGVETFHDISTELGDFQRAQRIQSQCLLNEAVDDPRLEAHVHYAPHDVVGGDFCAISRPAPDRYAFIVADVMGHGISAALYTMYLRSLWDDHRSQETPAALLSAMNRRLSSVMSGHGAFATAVCGMLDVGSGCLRLSSAGGPGPMLFHADGSQLTVSSSGFPMGLIEDGEYDQIERRLDRGTRLLLCSDGAVEICGADGRQLGIDGLMRLLCEMGYPAENLDYGVLEQRLLTYSNRIRFDDDLTFLEIHR